MARPLEVEGTLVLHRSTLAVDIRGVGRDVVCDLPSLSAGWAILMLARRAPMVGLPLASILAAADVKLSVRVRGRVVAEAGPGIAPGRVARWLGLSGMRFRSFRKPIA